MAQDDRVSPAGRVALPTATTATVEAVESERENENKPKIILDDITGKCYMYNFRLPYADIHFKNILYTTDFRPDVVKMKDKTYITSRQVAYYADDGVLDCKYQPWNIYISHIKDYIEKLSGYHFNYAVLNLYVDGNDTIGYHRDKEVYTERSSIIFSVSLGTERDFLVKPETDIGKANWIRLGRTKPYSVKLGHGAMLVMAGDMQYHYKHSVPKRADRSIDEHNIVDMEQYDKYKKARINITFRHKEI